VASQVLRCEECGRRAETPEEARRWRAYLNAPADEAEQDEVEGHAYGVAVYCPDCAEREFS
jgi:hypothetical protein